MLYMGHCSMKTLHVPALFRRVLDALLHRCVSRLDQGICAGKKFPARRRLQGHVRIECNPPWCFVATCGPGCVAVHHAAARTGEARAKFWRGRRLLDRGVAPDRNSQERGGVSLFWRARRAPGQGRRGRRRAGAAPPVRRAGQPPGAAHGRAHGAVRARAVLRRGVHLFRRGGGPYWRAAAGQGPGGGQRAAGAGHFRVPRTVLSRAKEGRWGVLKGASGAVVAGGGVLGKSVC